MDNAPLHNGKERMDKNGEAFTPFAIVNTMLDFLTPDAWECDKTFLDPTCGNGQMLVRFLERKLAKGHAPLQALSTCYGADIMADNIATAKHRLAAMVAPLLTSDSERGIAARILNHNVFLVKDSLSFDWENYQPFNLKRLLASAPS